MKLSKEKLYIENVISELCKKNGFTYLKELKFHPVRRFRFDYAIVEEKIAVEYEGIFSYKSRHTTKGGYSNDVIKYNEAAKLGWRVLRYTAKNYGNIENDLLTILKQKSHVKIR